MLRSFAHFSRPRDRVANDVAAVARCLRSKNSSHRPKEHGAFPSGLQVGSSKVSPHGAKRPRVLDVP